jgi:hypothetical protein
MKKLVLPLITLFLAGLTVSRLASQNPPANPPFVLPVSQQPYTNYTLIDPVSFQAVPPDGVPEKVTGLNTPELVETRRGATWAFEAPENFNAHHPFPAQIVAAAHRISLLNTDRPNRSPEQVADDNKAYDAILHPGRSQSAHRP